MNKTIYSVIHFKENAEKAIERILSFAPYSKIGLEVTQRELELYRSIYKSGYPLLSPKDMEERLTIELNKCGGVGNDDFRKYTSSKIFWFELCKALDEENVNIGALGSEKRITFLNSISMSFDGEWAYPITYRMVLGPYFNEYLAKRILEEGYDSAVLGVGHASSVASQTNFELENIGFKLEDITSTFSDLKSWCGTTEREYITLDDSVRQQLPDLRD